MTDSFALQPTACYVPPAFTFSLCVSPTPLFCPSSLLQVLRMLQIRKGDLILLRDQAAVAWERCLKHYGETKQSCSSDVEFWADIKVWLSGGGGLGGLTGSWLTASWFGCGGGMDLLTGAEEQCLTYYGEPKQSCCCCSYSHSLSASLRPSAAY